MADRDERGRFLPGVSGNPTGAPAMREEVREILNLSAPYAVKRIIKLLQETKDERLVYMCAKDILDRAYGKPKEQTDENAIGDGPKRAVIEIVEQKIIEVSKEDG